MFMHPAMYQRQMPFHQMPGFPMNVGAVPERPGMMPSMPSSAQPQVPLQQTGPPMSMMIPQGPHAMMDPRLMQMSGPMMGPYGYGGMSGMPGMPGMGMGMGMGGMHPGMYANGGMYPGGGMMHGGAEGEDHATRKPTVRFDDAHRPPAGASQQTSTASTPAQTAGINPYGFGLQQGAGPSYSSHLSSGNPLAYSNQQGYSHGYASPASPAAAHSYPNTPGWGGGYDARSDPFAMQDTASTEHAGAEAAHHPARPAMQTKRSWYAPRQAITR